MNTSPVVYLIDKERRESGSDNLVRDERRKNKSLTKGQLNEHLELLKWEMDKLIEYYKDKEKKKLLLLSGGVISVIMPLFGFLTGPTLKSPNDSLLVAVVLLGISAINISIIKFIISMKSDIVCATRQINCTRQAILAVCYIKLEGNYPTDSVEALKTESESLYWNLIGKHVKLPIENNMFRARYKSPYIWFKSADYFAIIVIAGFTILISLYPFMSYIYSSFIGINQSEPAAALVLAITGGAMAVLFILSTYIFIKHSLKEVDRALARDEEN